MLKTYESFTFSEENSPWSWPLYSPHFPKAVIGLVKLGASIEAAWASNFQYLYFQCGAYSWVVAEQKVTFSIT